MACDVSPMAMFLMTMICSMIRKVKGRGECILLDLGFIVFYSLLLMLMCRMIRESQKVDEFYQCPLLLQLPTALAQSLHKRFSNLWGQFLALDKKKKIVNIF